jgi:hypothetical protein
MSQRTVRRAEARNARKLARKAGFPIPPATTPETVAAAALPREPVLNTPESETATSVLDIPEPGFPFPSLKEISPARLTANRANAQRSTGATTQAGREASSQNHTLHGLARHTNGTFKLTAEEDVIGFEAFKQSLIAEHQPATPTESILINTMVESHWLANRALRLQDTCLDPHTGAITSEKTFSLYMRYQTTHTRAFHKALNDLLKLRAEKRKAELGFEAQRIATEKHEMKKQSHYWDVLKKDGEACHQISTNTLQSLKAEEFPGFEAGYALQLAKHGVKEDPTHLGTQAA